MSEYETRTYNELTDEFKKDPAAKFARRYEKKIIDNNVQKGDLELFQNSLDSHMVDAQPSVSVSGAKRPGDPVPPEVIQYVNHVADLLLKAVGREKS